MSSAGAPISLRLSAETPLQVVKHSPARETLRNLRLFFWSLGLAAAAFQAWVFRFQVSADSISYLDMSDGVMPGGDWHRLINGIWSPLYPVCLGIFRRLFGISAANEIVAAHWLNVVFFVFAFVCFEVFLQRWYARLGVMDPSDPPVKTFPFPVWVYSSLAYALFLWASLTAISLRYLRADMLLSGFLYVAAGLLLDMRGRPGRWRDYLVLGVVFGVGFLAKAPILPVAFLVLVLSLFAVEDRRAALKMAAAALGIVLLIGSLYFVPLSLLRGHFTIGDSGPYNYLVNIDRAGPGQGWYLERPGQGAGGFRHPPQKIFSSPPVYAFDRGQLVTHPLRFDPAVWMEGVRPRFALKRQIGESLANVVDLGRASKVFLVLTIAICAWLHLSRPWWAVMRNRWPMLIMGSAGCAMYLAVHLEPRYVAPFLVLFWCGVLAGLGEAHRTISRRAFLATTVLLVGSLLLPIAMLPYSRYIQQGANPDSLAAAQLASMGLQPGDRVARISSVVNDLGIERTARLVVASEVDFTHADEYWSAPLATQHQILSLFASRGIRAVIATEPKLTEANLS
ncbi:MAG TPA: hypothetical protein VFB00_02785, partial [Terriglobales bacterium]|nr:hypothetical protein [Terriglobales bacterium]